MCYSYLQLPGFYYDKEKKKYFKILPNSSCIGKSFTKEGIKIKEKEETRKSDLLYPIKPRTETPRRHQLSVYDNCLPCVTCNFQKGLLSNRQLDHTLHKIRLKNLNTTPQTRIQIYSDTRRDWLERLENANQLEMIDNKHMIGLFSLKDSMIQRILWLKLSDKPSSSQKDRLSLSIDPFPSCSNYQSAVKISSMSLIDKDSVLYTGMVYTGTPESLVFIKGFGEGSSRYEVYSLGQKATWTCAWNKHANQFSVGSEKCGLLLDVQTRRLWEINTHNSDVLCQVFSKQNGNCLYSGTRNSQIFTHDLRSISTYAVNQLTQSSSVCGLQLLQNDVHLLASDVKGQINLWDLRTRKVVTEYLGSKNEYLRIPIHVDQSEEIVYGVDQEGYTRLWCLQTGELMKTIPPPMATSYDFFPSVLYSKTWNDRQGNTGLLMGLGDKVYVYSDYTDMAINDC
ncbi:DDB1- and CUL4-associated factor 4-like [Mytilus trossulus]|uniref:DDB1- and CUL4-associated factor 4-like n=1 Tax=Mytilus trossulus TaxID=6551 RepID=UPI003007545F